MDIEAVIDAVIAREDRAFTDAPADAGGATKFGVTQATLSAWRGRAASADDVRNLGEEDARRIYRFKYVTQPGFGGIRDEALKALVVDCGVLHGVDRAAGWLQAAAGVAADGKVGPESIAAVNAARPLQLYLRICAARWRFMGEITAQDPAHGLKFVHGWCNRGSGFLDRIAPIPGATEASNRRLAIVS